MEDARGWLGSALSLAREGNEPRALEALRHAQLLAQDDAPLLIGIAKLFDLLEMSGDAITSLRRAVAISPELIEGHELLGTMLIRAGDLRAAALVLRVALSRHPDAAGLHHRLAEALLVEGRPADALREAQRAIELGASGAELQRARAEIFDRLGRNDACIEALTAVLELEPEDKNATIALGRKLAEAGRGAEAAELLLPIADRGLASVEQLIELGLALHGAGVHEGALRSLREAARIEPGSVTAHLKIGLILRQMGDTMNAIGSLRAAAVLSPDDLEISLHLGDTLREAGDAREATKVLARAAATAPEDERIQEALAISLAELRNTPRPAPRSSQPSETTGGGITSDLSLFSLPELLEFLMHQRSSGKLSLSGPLGDGWLELHEGHLVGGRAPGGKALAQYLVEEELIGQTDLKRSVPELELGINDVQIASTLLRRNLIDRELLQQVMRKQLVNELAPMVAWREGLATFSRRLSREKPEITVDTRFAVMEALRLLDELQRTQG